MKKTILCFGDSNTWGYIPGIQERYSYDVRWPGLLQKLLGEDFLIIEEGQNSRTISNEDSVKGYKNGLSYLIPCMESHKPIDLIIIMLGTNDMQERFNLNAYNIARSMERLVNHIQSSKDGKDKKPPLLMIVSPIFIGDNLYDLEMGENLGKGCIEKSHELAKYPKRLAEESECYFVDAAQIASPSPIDAVHLDDKGHQALANHLFIQIKKIFD